ncbi:SLBB domain-containing protein [Roseivirga sp.]|uniref:SLBB domain-containing protein n=1 Tax=Roseivirga sp. TaxID=1964215 RepID=UPI003B51F890
MNISSLSDQQIESYIKQARAMGYSEQDLISLAQSQGLSASDISLLNERINSVKTARASRAQGAPVESTRLRQSYTDSLQALNDVNSDIYGLDVFRKGSFLSFQTNQNIPTPDNYVLGAGDEVFIDIYGASESYYQAEINPDGNILLENIGPISLSGLSIQQAKTRVIARLSTLYDGLKGNTPNTFLNLSLGQVRSVSVNIVGQVAIPGTYNLSALNTVFNALYAAGGVTENGTLREIRHFRKGQLLSKIDLYQFLQNGFIEGDNRVENGDVILVAPYTNRVSVSGAVKIAGRFELLENETVSDLLNYTGGFSENAFTESVKLNRIQNGQKLVADINADQFEVFSTKPGDQFFVAEVLNRFANRVVVTGAVFRPGNYSIGEGLTIGQLLEKTEGVRPDALLSRALVKRSNDDLTTETISFNLSNVLNGSDDFELRREDVVTIFSTNDLKEESFIEVIGEVNEPGLIDFSQGTTVRDALLLSGGLTSSAFGGNIEVSRRVISASDEAYGLSDTFTFNIDLNGDLETGRDFILTPYDQVIIRRNPVYTRQQLVTVEGQVNSPGQYSIKNQGERISDLLERAGGLNQFAFIEGATLIRKTEFYEEPTDIEKQIDDLIRLQEKFDRSPDLLTEAEMAMISRIEEDIADLEMRNESNQSFSNYAKRERIKEVIQRNALTTNIELKQAEAIGIDLQSIIQFPGSVSDLLLEEGDVLIVPKRSETVRMRGKLLYPTTSRFVEGKSLKYYINNAGGFDYRAKKKGTYVVYANGEVARTKSFLFLKFYPKPAPGAEIIVPTKPLKVPVRLQDVLAITSGLATLALVVNQISQNN